MAIILDIETVALPPEVIEAGLPQDLRNPIMPAELANPFEPDWGAKCPEYSLPALIKKAELAKAALDEATRLAKPAKPKELEKFEAGLAKMATVRDKANEAVADAEAKRKAWIDERTGKFRADAEEAREKWKADKAAARKKIFDNAALDARTGAVKLIGIRDTLEGETVVFVVESDERNIAILLEGDFGQGRRPELKLFATEGSALKAFFAELKTRIESAEMLDGDGVCVGYYIKDFDFPFMYRRAWMNGVPQVPIYRRGRYFGEEIQDLHEIATFGERQYGLGGLDGLSAMLGCQGCKTGDGGGFGESYAKDPTEGIAYLLNDLELTEDCGRKMGVVGK